MTSPEFRAALKSLGLRQYQLAERLGVENSTVNRWAVGKAVVPQYVAYVLELLANRNEKDGTMTAPKDLVDAADNAAKLCAIMEGLAGKLGVPVPSEDNLVRLAGMLQLAVDEAKRGKRPRKKRAAAKMP